MVNHEDENVLIGYIVGALGDEEVAATKQRLRNDSDFSYKYERLLTLFRPALQERDRDAQELQPPEGLAARTMAFILRNAPVAVLAGDGEDEWTASQKSSSDSGTRIHTIPTSETEELGEAIKETVTNRVQETQVHGIRPEPVRMTPRVESSPASFSRWYSLDSIVALGLLCCVGLFLFQAVAFSKHDARVTECQNNLRQLGVAMQSYAAAHNGEFPSVKGISDPTLQVAGIYGPILLDIQPKLARFLFCPDVTAKRGKTIPHVPGLTELTKMSPDEVKKHLATLGGDYSYNVGYFRDGVYYPPRSDTRTHLPLLADEQKLVSGRRLLVPGHGDSGHNILYKDGSVHFRTAMVQDGDNVFLNDQSEIAMGLDFEDTVLGSSETPIWMNP